MKQMNTYDISVHNYYKFLLIAEASFKIMIPNAASDETSMDEICEKFLDEINLRDTSYSVNDSVFFSFKKWMEEKLKTKVDQNTEMNKLISPKERKKIVNALLDDMEIVFTNPFNPFIKNVYWPHIQVLLFVAAIASLFYNITVGSVLMIVFLTAIFINPHNNKFKTITLRDFTDKLARENYNNFNSNEGSVNHKEVRTNLIAVFSELIEKKITPETRFIIYSQNSE